MNIFFLYTSTPSRRIQKTFHKTQNHKMSEFKTGMKDWRKAFAFGNSLLKKVREDREATKEKLNVTIRENSIVTKLPLNNSRLTV